MSHIFQSTLNTRPILEDSFKFIRSDVPTEVTESEKEWLLENDVFTIVDLRTDDERVYKRIFGMVYRKRKLILPLTISI